MALKNIITLINNNALTEELCIWGISNRTSGILDVLKEHKYKIVAVIDSFKSTYLKTFQNIQVVSAEEVNELNTESMTLLVLGNYTDAIIKQAKFLKFKHIINLNDLNWKPEYKNISIPWHFTNRSFGKENLVYILAGYQKELWESTIARVELYQSEEFDYCICSSGIYSEELAEIAERNHWSYLYTEKNQVSFIQNHVINLHPRAKYIIKMDEDIIISKSFFSDMLKGYHELEKDADSRIGFVVPVIPLNCAGYVSFLHTMKKEDKYKERFGRIYRSRFSAYMEKEMAPFLWDMIDDFDIVSDLFSKSGVGLKQVIFCYFNISCIMYSRERWHMMGMWPEDTGTGMGNDEMYICKDNFEKDLAIFELGNVLAGHIAFGPQREIMNKYYADHKTKFLPKTL